MAGIVWNPESAHAKEMAKWERTYTQYGPPGLPPYTYQPYPAAMYQASRDEQGRLEWDLVIVEDLQEQRNLESRGYVAGGKGEALAALERQERGIAELAANRVAQERRMSAQARAEAEVVDDATDLHVPVIPEKRARRQAAEAALKGEG